MKLVRSKTKKPEQRKGYTRTTLIHHPLKTSIDSLGTFLVEIPVSGKVDPHYHEKATEFYYILRPGMLIVNGEEFEVEEGDVVIIEPKEVHWVKAKKDEVMRLVAIKLPNTTDDRISVD